MAAGRGDPVTPSYQLMMISIVLAAMMPSQPLMVSIALFLRFALFFSVGGPLSNSQNWAMHLDLTLLLALLPYVRRRSLTAEEEMDVVRIAGPTSRLQLIVFYLASGIWKLNSSFMDWRYSCASIYFVSLVGHRLTDRAEVLHALSLIHI